MRYISGIQRGGSGVYAVGYLKQVIGSAGTNSALFLTCVVASHIVEQLMWKNECL